MYTEKSATKIVTPRKKIHFFVKIYVEVGILQDN